MGIKIKKDLFDKLQKLQHAYINDKGQEMLNPIPKELASAMERPLTMQERVQEAVARALSVQAELQEYETLKDACNFDLEDPMAVKISGYEYDDLPLMPEDPELEAEVPDTPENPSDPEKPPETPEIDPKTEGEPPSEPE